MKLLDKLKSKLNLEDGWVPFVSDQLKWGTAFFIRITAIVVTILFVLFLTKWSGIVAELRSLMNTELNVTSKGSNVISSPDINYDKDLENINDVIDMLESKRQKKDDKTKESKNTKENNNTK